MKQKETEGVFSIKLILIYGVLTAAILIVFGAVRHFDFINYDDYAYIRDNPYVSTGLTAENVSWAFRTAYLGYWQPLTWISLMTDCHVFGVNSGASHCVNLFLHILNTCLLFHFLRRMTDLVWPSVCVAAAFALHPMHVESVAWVVERKDVLSTFWFLWALIAYTRYVDRPAIWRYLAVLVLMACSLMTKPTYVTFPFILCLLDYWPLGRVRLTPFKPEQCSETTLFPARVIIEKIPFLILVLISSVVTYLTQGSGGSVTLLADMTFGKRMSSVVLSYGVYIGKLFWPQKLSVFYPYPDSVGIGLTVACVVLLAGVSYAAIRWGGRHKYLFVGWFWFLGSLVPVIGVVGFTDSIHADRFSYVPYIGLFLVVVWGAAEWGQRCKGSQKMLGTAALVLMAAMGVWSYKQLGYWKNSQTLFAHALTTTRENYLAYNNLGTAYTAEGNYPQAISLFAEALKIKPNDPEINNNMGAACYVLGRYDQAIEAYQRAIASKPDYAKAYCNLGTVYGDLKRYDQAIEILSHAVRLNKNDVKSLLNLGVAFYCVGQDQQALEKLKNAILLDPQYAQAHFAIGMVYLGQGDLESAIQECRILKGLDTKLAQRLMIQVKSQQQK